MKLQQELQLESALFETRRHFLKQCTSGLGMMALGTMFGGCGTEKKVGAPIITNPLDPKIAQFAAKAKSVIFMHMCGSPSQLELWDYKPELTKLDGQPCPPSFLEGK